MVNEIGEYFSLGFILHNTGTCFEIYLPVSFWFKKDQTTTTRLLFSGSDEIVFQCRFSPKSLSFLWKSPVCILEQMDLLFGSHTSKFINSTRINNTHQCGDFRSHTELSDPLCLGEKLKHRHYNTWRKPWSTSWIQPVCVCWDCKCQTFWPFWSALKCGDVIFSLLF